MTSKGTASDHRAWLACDTGHPDCMEQPKGSRGARETSLSGSFPRASRFPPDSKDGPFGLLESRFRPVSLDFTGRCEPRCVPGLAVAVSTRRSPSPPTPPSDGLLPVLEARTTGRAKPLLPWPPVWVRAFSLRPPGVTVRE